jgi:hypothetical protein
MYIRTSDSEAPGAVSGKVMRTVLASGRRLYGSGSSEFGWKSNWMVEPAPDRVVAAYEIWDSWHSGIKNVDVQPAPIMRISTDIEAQEGFQF